MVPATERGIEIDVVPKAEQKEADNYDFVPNTEAHDNEGQNH